jgi:hypothetical protein
MAGTTNDLLKGTSRSFYLTLRALAGAVRPQIGVAKVAGSIQGMESK